MNADDFAKRKTFDISKLLQSMPTPQVTPTPQLTPTLQVMSTPQTILVNKVIVSKPSTLSKPPPSPTIELDLDKKNSDTEETMQTTNNASSDTMQQSTPAVNLIIPGLVFQFPRTSGQTLAITTPPKNIGIRWCQVLKGEHHFQCKNCLSKFKKLCSLMTHQANMCLNKRHKKFKCSDCEESYANMQSLQDHQSQKHSGKNRYSCKHCGQIFYTNNEAVTHRKICIAKLVTENTGNSVQFV